MCVCGGGLEGKATTLLGNLPLPLPPEVSLASPDLTQPRPAGAASWRSGPSKNETSKQQAMAAECQFLYRGTMVWLDAGAGGEGLVGRARDGLPLFR